METAIVSLSIAVLILVICCVVNLSRLGAIEDQYASEQQKTRDVKDGWSCDRERLMAVIADRDGTIRDRDETIDELEERLRGIGDLAKGGDS